MHRQTGMTLIEIMMVVVIIGILVAVIVPNVIGYDDDARIAAQRMEIRTIGQALEMYRLHNGAVSVDRPGSRSPGREAERLSRTAELGTGAVSPQVPAGPVDNEYVYIAERRTYQLVSLGADGVEGGEGVDADISSADI